ncbi:MAG: hypothetical protein KAJ03_09215 [Gammaproteobacteria bacterium]|nr:hypothetical protein [Gammaproteobacteria bacterium]
MIHSIRTFARWFSLMIIIWTPFAEAVTLSEDDLIVLNLKTHTMPAGAVVQTDGKLILAGATMQDEAIQVVLARYYPSGKLDASFGKSGYTFTRIPNWHAHANAVELDGAGNILIGGTVRDGNRKKPQYFLIRYLNSGKLDHDFNGSGIRLNALE